MPKKSTSFGPAYVVLVALVLIRFLPFAVGTKWLWGVGHLTLLPIGYLLGSVMLAAVTLILPFMPQAESWGGSLADWFTQTFFESKSRYRNRVLVLLLFGATFVVFRMPTHFLGDGYTYLANLGSRTGHWTRWTEGGAMGLVLAIQSVLGPPSEETVLLSYQGLSVIGGLLSLWFYFLIAREISPDRSKRLLAFVVLTFSSSLLLYFGYVESYPILWGPVAGFLFFSLRYAREGKGIFAALICLLIAMILHLQVGMFVPAVGFLLLSRGKGNALYRRFRIGIWVLVGSAVVVFGFLFFRKFGSDVAFQNIFLFPFHGKPASPGYAMFSLKHLSDLLNLFLLVYPAGMVILVLGLSSWRKAILDRTAVYLCLLTVGSKLFLLLIDPGLSMPRDWDLFALCWLAPTGLLLHLIPEKAARNIQRLTVSLGVLSLMAVGSFLAVNLDRDRSVAEVKQIISNNVEKSFGTLSILKLYCWKTGDRGSLDSLESLRRAWYPDFFKLRSAFEAMKAGNYADADSVLRTVRPDPYSKDFHQTWAELYMREGKFDSALVHAEIIVQLQPTYDQGYLTISSAHYLRGEYDQAMAALRRGLSLNEESVPLTTGLAANFLTLHQPDSTFFYASRAIALDSNAVQPYFYLSQADDALGRRDAAREDARKFLTGAEGKGEYSGYRKQLLQEFPELDTVKADSAGSVDSPRP